MVMSKKIDIKECPTKISTPAMEAKRERVRPRERWTKFKRFKYIGNKKQAGNGQ